MGRFFAVVVLLAAIVIGVGFYLDWFDFTRTTSGERTQYTVQVNKDKVRHDTHSAVESAQDAGRRIKEGAQDLIAGKSAKGKLVEVNAAAGTLSVDTGAAEPLRFTTLPESKVQTSKEAKRLDDLSPGQQLTVAYHEDKNGARIADTITIEQP